MKMNRSISPILTLKLVAMATSIERSKKVRSLIDNHGESMMKISPVDPEIICLKGIF